MVAHMRDALLFIRVVKLPLKWWWCVLHRVATFCTVCNLLGVWESLPTKITRSFQS